jgi:hypothetical protein
MAEIGLDKMAVRAIFRRYFTISAEEDSSWVDCVADAVSEVVKENNKKFLGNLQEVLEKTRRL